MTPKVHFGEIDAEDEDWREGLVDEDPDDEELDVSPKDVVDILGFDPKEFSTGKKSPVVNNTALAILILNAKKGWTEEARKKAAMTRKRKSSALDLRTPKTDSIKSNLDRAFKAYQQAKKDGKPLKELAKALTKARNDDLNRVKALRKAKGTQSTKPAKKAVPKKSKSTKVELENMGGAGIAYKHPTKGYVSAYGGGWTKNPDNAAVHGSKSEAKAAGERLLVKSKKK